MKKNRDEKESVDRRIEAFLVECGDEFDCDRPAVLSVWEGVHFHHQLRDGTVEVREVSGGELSRLQRFVGYFSEIPSDGMLARVEAELDAEVPDLDAIETWLREDALSVSAARLKRILETKGARLPAPSCPCCEQPMRRESALRGKRITSTLGKFPLMRAYHYCRSCKRSSVPLDVSIGMVRKSLTPGMERSIVSVSSEVSSYRAAVMLRELTGVSISRSRLDREARRLGTEIVDFDQKDVVVPETGPALPVVALDGTGVPMRRSETEGREGRREGQPAGTRESKVIRICEVERRGKGGAVRAVAGSITQTAMIDSARLEGGGTLSEVGARLERESRRRGVFHAAEVVVLSDGAPWIEKTARQVYAGQTITFILDLFHVLEKLQDALKETTPDDDERAQSFGQMKSLIKQGKIEQVLHMLAPCATQHGKVATFIGYCRTNQHRMRYDEYQERGLPCGSGLIEAGCKHVVAERLKKSGAKWIVDGANGMMASRCCIFNNRLTDFFHWRENHYRKAA